MKIKLITQIVLSLIVLCFIASCNVTSINIEVLIPAKINVPQNMQKVGIINRSLPDKKEMLYNIVEGFFTGENIMGDCEGSDWCIKGLNTKLNSAPRFAATTIPGANIKGTGTREFALPISWDVIQNLCKTYSVDGIIILETFDSNVLLETGSKKKEQKVEGRDTVIIEHFAKLRMNVGSGWRIYDPLTKKIVDESTFTDEKSWYETGKSHESAMSKLPNKRDAINNAGLHSGEMYAIRISPTWFTVLRSFYVRGHVDFAKAKSYFNDKQLDKSMEIWKQLVYNTDNKIVGRALFNLAFGYEQKGDLNSALECAEKANRLLKNGRSAGYIETLKSRISDQQKLKNQLGK